MCLTDPTERMMATVSSLVAAIAPTIGPPIHHRVGSLRSPMFSVTIGDLCVCENDREVLSSTVVTATLMSLWREEIATPLLPIQLVMASICEIDFPKLHETDPHHCGRGNRSLGMAFSHLAQWPQQFWVDRGRPREPDPLFFNKTPESAAISRASRVRATIRTATFLVSSSE